MTAGKGNLPASVAARLLNRAKQTGDVYQVLLTSFCFERFLYRLGKSEVRERFVLKGAMPCRPRQLEWMGAPRDHCSRASGRASPLWRSARPMARRYSESGQTTKD